MRRDGVMAAFGAAIGALGVLAGIAIGSAKAPVAAMPVRKPQPIVRTIVIHKTVRTYKRSGSAAPKVAGGGTGGSRPAVAPGAATAYVPTSSSYPVTRTSTHSTSGTGTYGSAPVSTHTSGSTGGGSTGGAVTTHSSGGGSGHDDNGGERESGGDN